MANIINSSPNIAVLDSRIVANLCTGNFEVDISPSVWIATGYDNVLGARVQVQNPYNVIVRAYPSGYDVTPAFSGGIEAVTFISVPTQSSNFQYGNYIISVQLTDADGTNYTVTKTISICAPNLLDKTKNYGNVSATISGICNDGKVYILVSEPPTYKGFMAESTSQSFTLEYPTRSILAPIQTQVNSFSVQLFEGVYNISGNICATYNYGDNLYADVNYVVSNSKSILCSLDQCCVFTGLQALNAKLISDCSDADKKATQSSIEQAALLISTIEFGASCGQDVSDYITSLETVLGMTCSCSFNNGTPIINNNPASDILIQGCNVESETVGLTKVYTLNLYSYNAIVADNGGAFTVADVVLNGCVNSQTFTFNISNVYTQIKGLAVPSNSSQSLAESHFWASVVKGSLNAIDASCLGLNTSQLTALTLDAFIQVIINKACQGGGCDATMNSITATQSGGDVILSWTQTNSYSIDIYVDNTLFVTVLGSASSYTLSGYSDGATHSFRIVSKCSNGVYGTALSGSFVFSGCPTINPPVVSSTSIGSATCPFNLTGLVSALPTGISAQWYLANNHLPANLVPDPTNVTDGIYYVYATNGTGCWSTNVKVTLVCAVISSCSAPQVLSATSIIGGVKVAFSSAVYPPPSNSYTIKRKLESDPDVDGSYTTIGTPTFNVSTGKWEITDTTAAANTYYTYKAISNCATPQSILLNYATITCPTLTLTSDDSDIYYSFSDVGGQINKYTVEIWDAGGITLIHTDTYTPTFPSPIVGSFSYLGTGFGYKVRVIPWIGVASFPCVFYNKYTSSPLSLSVSKAGAYSGTLSSSVSGGVPPYSYAWTYVAAGGSCQSASIGTPTTGTTTYSATAYSGVSYTFTLTVTDNVGTIAAQSAPPTGSCLVPDTMITMHDLSAVKLDDIQEGDRLLDIDMETGEDVMTIVTSKTYHHVKKLYVINEGLLETSEGHINIINTGVEYDLKQSLNLVQGELLPAMDLSDVEIVGIEVKEGDFIVINISTTTEKYIANGIITHNKLACP